MSVQYRPVTWTRNKITYDLVLGFGIAAFIILFLRYAPGWLESPRISGPQLRMRAFGTCAFLLLTILLSIGPLARLDSRFLPLLYNRRHFGVAIFFVALAHALAVTGWYQAFGPLDRYVALLASSSAVTSWQAFPFEYLGIFALPWRPALEGHPHDRLRGLRRDHRPYRAGRFANGTLSLAARPDRRQRVSCLRPAHRGGIARA